MAVDLVFRRKKIIMFVVRSLIALVIFMVSV